MIEINNIEVFNFEGAFRGLRNPMNSWEKSDSYFGTEHSDFLSDCVTQTIEFWIEEENKIRIKEGKQILVKGSNEYNIVFDKYMDWLLGEGVVSSNQSICNIGYLGPKDLDLAQRMIKGGAEEAKFLRQIFVSMDITAPIFWWKEASTYKIATTANSCSTMHTIHKTPITKDMFSFSNFNFNQDMVYDIIDICETLRQKYNETKDKNYWRALIEILPMGFNQKRTWTANYQVLRNIYFQRRNHKLEEWHVFCEMIESLPYGKELICYTGE